MNRVELFCIALACLLFGISGERCKDGKGIFVDGSCYECTSSQYWGKHCDKHLCNHNGYYIAQKDVCACNAGTAGSWCEQCINGVALPTGGCSVCQNNGTFIEANGTCTCGNEYTGLTCESLRCSGNGYFDAKSGECNCIAPFTGDRCNECSRESGLDENGVCILCKNGGFPNEDHSECTCSEHYEGEDCSNIKCEEEGTVTSTPTSCTCNAQFEGERCERSVCKGRGYFEQDKCICDASTRSFGNKCEHVCENGGTPKLNHNGCNCEGSQFDGVLCSINRCNDRGVFDFDNGACNCSSGATGERCQHCPDHRSGATCEIVCSGNGEVVDGACKCSPKNRGGDNCEDLYNAQECSGLGTFVDVSQSCDCNTRAMASGNSCKCVKNAQLNAITRQCDCKVGNISEHCHVCLNGGTPRSGEEAVCNCQQGYSGYDCNEADDLRKALDRLQASPHKGIRSLGKWMGNRPFTFMNPGECRYTIVANRGFTVSDTNNMKGEEAILFMMSFVLTDSYSMEELQEEFNLESRGYRKKVVLVARGKELYFTKGERGVLLNDVELVSALDSQNRDTNVTILESNDYIALPQGIATRRMVSSAQSLNIGSIAAVMALLGK